MKTFLVIFALATVSLAAPQEQNPDATAQTLKNNAVVNTDSYQWEYETSNQIKANEQGQLKEIGTEKGIAAQGAFSYVSPDGTPISLTYVADENGFQPQGSHLPVSPEIPEAIARALKYIAEHPQPEEQKH